MPVGARPPSRSDVDSSGTGTAQVRPRSEARTSAKASFETTNEFSSSFAPSLISSGYPQPGSTCPAKTHCTPSSNRNSATGSPQATRSGTTPKMRRGRARGQAALDRSFRDEKLYLRAGFHARPSRRSGPRGTLSLWGATRRSPEANGGLLFRRRHAGTERIRRTYPECVRGTHILLGDGRSGQEWQLWSHSDLRSFLLFIDSRKR
jgi:hypothetical protein